MKRRIMSLKETIKATKKATKDKLFIQFSNSSAYISEGHYICKIPDIFYTNDIFTAVPGLPAYTDGSSFVIEHNKPYEESTVDLVKIMPENPENEAIGTAPTSISVKIKDCYARAFIYDTDTETVGTLINEDFLKISTEYTNGTYYCKAKNIPVYTSKCDGDFACLILPINYTGETDINRILEALNSVKKSVKAA